MGNVFKPNNRTALVVGSLNVKSSNGAVMTMMAMVIAMMIMIMNHHSATALGLLLDDLLALSKAEHHFSMVDPLICYTSGK